MELNLSLWAVRQLGDSVLRSNTSVINNFDESFLSLVNTMFRVMDNEHGVGLAAPQIGVSKKVFVASTSFGRIVVANPVVEKKSGFQLSREQCLSIKNQEPVSVPRPLVMTVSGQNSSGKDVTYEVSDFDACIFSHEMDHLNGVLIADYLPTD